MKSGVRIAPHSEVKGKKGRKSQKASGEQSIEKENKTPPPREERAAAAEPLLLTPSPGSSPAAAPSRAAAEAKEGAPTPGSPAGQRCPNRLFGGADGVLMVLALLR